MSSVLRAVVLFFQFIIELIADIICFCLLIAAAVAIWRVPFWPTELQCGSRNKYRFSCIYAFGTSLGDIVTIPIACIVLCSWRSIAFCTELPLTNRSDKACWFEHRMLAWHQFLRLLLDIPFILMMLFTCITFWRIPLLVLGLLERCSSDSCPLLGCREDTSSSGVWDPFHTRYRAVILFHFLNGLFELLCGPIFLLLFISVYRAPALIGILRDPLKDSVEKKVLVLKLFGNLVLDIPFLLCGLFTMLLIIRAKYLIEDIRTETACIERRRVAALNALLTIRDLLLLIPFVIVLASVYRGYLMMKQILTKAARWADPNAKATVLSGAFEAPIGRPTGLVLRVRVSKPSDFSLAPDTPLRAFVRDDSLWGAVKRSHGATAAAVGPSMMPISLNRFIKPETVVAQQDTQDLVFDFDVSQKTTSLLREGAKVNHPFILQVEYGNHEGTLLALKVTIGASMDRCTVESTDLQNADTVGKRYGDVAWKVILLQFVMLLLDIIALVFFVVLHLIPPRVYRVYSQGCEGPARKTMRKIMDCIEVGIDAVAHAGPIVEQTIENTDRDLRCSQDAGGQRYEYRRSYTSYWGSRRRTLYCYYDGSGGASQPTTGVAAFATSCEPFATDFVEVINKSILDLAAANKRQAAEALFDAATETRSLLFSVMRAACTLHPEINISAPPAINAASGASGAGDPEAAGAGGGGLMRFESFTLGAAADNSPSEFRDCLSQPFGSPTGQPPDAQMTATASVPKEVKAMVTDRAQVHLERLRVQLGEVEAEYSRLPWCGGREGWPGFRSVVFREVAQTMLDFAAILSFLIVFFSLYRTYPLVWSLANRRQKDDVRFVCLRNLAEIAVDLFYLLKFIAVLIGVRGIISMPADLVSFLCVKPTFLVARQVIDHHLRLLLADLVYILSLVIAWDAIRLTVATVVFGAFAPGVMLESAFAKWEDEPAGALGGRAIIEAKNTCRAIYILFFSACWVFGLPCFCSYYIGQHTVTAVAAVYFSIMLAVCGLGILVAFLYRDPRVIALRRGVVRAVKPTWHNLLAYVGLGWETLLLIAVIFGSTDESVLTQYGAGERIRDASRYIFLEFGQSWTTNGFPFGFYATVALMLLHFVLAAMPIVTDQMLHWRAGSRLLTSVAWMTALQILGQHMLLLVARNVALMVTCSGATGRLIASPTVECYDGQHLHVSTLAMILFTYYLPSAVMRNSTVDESSCSTLDIAFTQLFRLLTNIGGAFAVVMSALLYHTPMAAISMVLIGAAWNLFWSFCYGPFVNSNEGTMVTVDAVKNFKIAQYAVVCIAAILVLIAQGSGASILWAAYATAGVCAVFWIATALVNWRASRRWRMEGIEEIRHRLFEAEAALISRGALSSRWSFARSPWMRSVNSATRASVLALAALELEKHTYIVMLPHGFFTNRCAFVRQALALVSECDTDGDINVDYMLDSRSWEHMIVCCDCGCCSHRDDDNSRQLKEDPEEVKLETLVRLVTTLRNAARGDVQLDGAAAPVASFEAPAAGGHARFLELSAFAAAAAQRAPPPSDLL